MNAPALMLMPLIPAREYDPVLGVNDIRTPREIAESRAAPRTVTTKVRYPDFSIRSRSTSLPVGIDDGERIGENHRPVLAVVPEEHKAFAIGHAAVRLLLGGGLIKRFQFVDQPLDHRQSFAPERRIAGIEAKGF